MSTLHTNEQFVCRKYARKNCNKSLQTGHRRNQIGVKSHICQACDQTCTKFDKLEEHTMNTESSNQAVKKLYRCRNQLAKLYSKAKLAFYSQFKLERNL